MSQADICAAGVQPLEWDIETLLERNSGPVLLYGPSESLKSWLAIAAASCIATGETFLNQFPVKRRSESVYLNFDAGHRDFERRVAMLGASISNFLIASPEGFTYDGLKGVLQAHEGAFVVLDCFADIYFPHRGDEQGQAMRQFVRSVRKLFETHGCNGIIVDHARRWKPGDPANAERYYGSVQKKAAIRQMWYVERLRHKEETTGRARAKVICEKQSEAEKFRSFITDFGWIGGQFSASYGGAFDDAMAKGEAALQHREAIQPYMDPVEHPDGVTTAYLSEKSHLTKKQILQALKTRGIKAIGKGKNTRYRLVDPVSADEELLEEDES